MSVRTVHPKALLDSADYRRRVAGFEFEVLAATGPDGGEVAAWPLAKLARQSEWLDGLPFETRRRAAIDVSERLDYELDKMEMPFGHVTAEAGARLDFLSALHTRFEAEASGNL